MRDSVFRPNKFLQPTAALQKRQEQEITLDTLKAGQRVKVNVSAMFIFLMRDGTHEHS